MQDEKKLFEEAYSLNNSEKYKEVVELLKDDLLQIFQNSNLYAEKAQAYWRLDEHFLCEVAVKKALEINVLNAKALNYQGNIFLKLKLFDKAMDSFNQVIKIDPNLYTAYYGLGIVHNSFKKFEKAIGFFEKAISINANFPYGYYAIGNVYLEMGNYKEAEEYYEKALEKDPKNSSAYNGLGNMYYNLAEYDKAMKFYDKAIEFNATYAGGYYNRALVFEKLEDYPNAINEYEKAIQYKDDPNDYFTLKASMRIEDLKDLLINPELSFISDLVGKIKNLLLFKDQCITHYTGFSAAKALILEGSVFRLSEGTYLNDTSEGRELFDFLPSLPTTIIVKKDDTIAKQFSTKPFIGSFVTETKHDDLTLWRMYGKENKDEARGCAITLERESFLESLVNLIIPDAKEANNTSNEEFNFYRVAYRKNESDKDHFIIPGAIQDEETLNALMFELREKLIQAFEGKTHIISIRNWSELNQIAYLFKSAEYQYEHELRLIVKGTGIKKIINYDFTPPKVCVELVKINPLMRKITLGPKVEKADEWASAFYYTLDQQGYNPDIFISHLPFK